jgi:hypothetical protein
MSCFCVIKKMTHSLNELSLHNYLYIYLFIYLFIYFLKTIYPVNMP